MSDTRSGRVWKTAARFAVSAALLWLVFRWVDADAVLERLSMLRPGWIAVGLGVSVLQVALLAWRWRLTAARFGIDLPLGVAVPEYYAGIVLNQLLPGGVLGDVSRAWRHSRAGAPGVPAATAVLLERASAQIVMTGTAVVCVLFLDWAPAWVRATGAGIVVVVTLLAVLWLARRPTTSVLGHLWADARRALLAGDVAAPQLVTALLAVASYVAVFVVAARAMGIPTPVLVLLPLVPPVLMTMLVPVTVAGWGMREAAAAALWGFAGLTPEDGAAISVAYGLIVLVASAPGLAVLMWGGPGIRGRRGRRHRA